MWKSVGSPHLACVFVTSTGIPRAAHTLLKFTPAAMTITSASCGPSSGTSMTSSRIASRGSPNRSGRTSCACIRRGTSPIDGISPMPYRSLPMLPPLAQSSELGRLTICEGRRARQAPYAVAPSGAALDGQTAARGHQVQ